MKSLPVISTSTPETKAPAHNSAWNAVKIFLSWLPTTKNSSIIQFASVAINIQRNQEFVLDKLSKYY